MIRIIKLLLSIATIVLFTACGSNSTDATDFSTVPLTAQETAIGNIIDFANNGQPIPTIEDYEAAGVVGVTDANIAQINEVVANLTEEEVDTKEEIQALLNELGLEIPDLNDTTPPDAPTVEYPRENGKTQVDVVIIGEVGATIFINNESTGIVIDADGATHIILTLVDGVNIFIATLRDTAYNMSIGTEFRITQTATATMTTTTTSELIDNIPPSIDLIGDALVYVVKGTSYTDAGATATDDTDGDITATIVTVNPVDINTNATYTITYNVTDAAGNAATEVKRTVIVADCPDGKSTLTHNGTEYSCVVSPHTNEVWLDRNLGASQACTSATDADCYGDYYQWGRNFDGHEKSASDLNTTLADDVNNAGTDFITTNGDWASVDVNGAIRVDNWSKTDGSSVCPTGYRVPTEVELTAETTSVTSNTDAFNSFLKLPSAGFRLTTGGMFKVGLRGVVWSASVDGSFSRYFRFDNGWNDGNRAFGISIRCIKD